MANTTENKSKVADIVNLMATGRLVKDAEVVKENEKSSIVRFSLACNRKKKVGDKYEDKAIFLDCINFGTQKALVPFLVKGTQVAVVAGPQNDDYEKDGKTYHRVTWVIDQLNLIGGKRTEKPAQNEAAAPEPETAAANDDGDDIPF